MKVRVTLIIDEPEVLSYFLQQYDVVSIDTLREEDNRVKAAHVLRDAGWRQVDIAEILGVSQPAIAGWLKLTPEDD